MHTVSFSNLDKSDLYIDAIYEGGNAGNAGSVAATNSTNAAKVWPYQTISVPVGTGSSDGQVVVSWG